MSDDVRETSEAPVPEAVGELAVLVTRTDRELWWEVVAVLAVGVIPYLLSAFVMVVRGPEKMLDYWFDALYLAVSSACVLYVVLYLMARSQEPWSTFGIVPVRWRDAWLTVAILLTDEILRHQILPHLPSDVYPRSQFPTPQGPGDYVLMVIKYVLSGLAEELVMRAYLITRLERLMRSRWLAVVVSAVLFASYHLYYGPGGTLIYLVFVGLLYGVCYLVVRRVWPLALAHVLSNIMVETMWG